jgi:hypothetical protein
VGNRRNVFSKLEGIWTIVPDKKQNTRFSVAHTQHHESFFEIDAAWNRAAPASHFGVDISLLYAAQGIY